MSVSSYSTPVTLNNHEPVLADALMGYLYRDVTALQYLELLFQNERPTQRESILSGMGRYSHSGSNLSKEVPS